MTHAPTDISSTSGSEQNSKAAVKAILEQLDACNQQEAARIVRLVAGTKGNPGQKDLEKLTGWLQRGLEKAQQRQALQIGRAHV